MTPVLLLCALAFGEPAPSASTQAAAAPQPSSLEPETDRLILDGLDALYSLDFARAERLLDEAGRLQPDHPAGPFFRAGLQWLQFSQNADLPGTVEQLEPEFNELMERTIKLAEKRLQKDDKDAEAEFYLGSAYGMRGRWQILKRHWIRAAFNGYRGYKRLKRCVELEPAFHDAYLGLGMYDYYSDTLPTVLKMAQVLVERGDKQRGLRYVYGTLENGHFSKTEAKLFLVGIYTGYENQPRKALEIIEDLRREKPGNPFFTFLEVIARIDAKDWVGAIAFGELLYPKFEESEHTRRQISLFQLYLASAYIGNKDYEKALAMLDRCIAEAPDARKAAVTYCHLRRAQLFDLQERRDAALKDYKFVARREDYWDSQEKAKKGLKSPATYDLIVRQLLE